MADVKVGDTLIRAGAGVVLPLVLANPDSSVCPHADELRLRRDIYHSPQAIGLAELPVTW